MKAQLETLAAAAPTARLSSAELWKHGRRRRRRIRSRVTAAIAALLGLAVVAGVPLARPPEPAAPGLTLPARLDPPPLWHKTWESDPNGPMLVGFRLSDNLFDNFRDGVTEVFVGRDGSFRLFPHTGPKVVSPDGRYLATWGAVLDLSTGASQPLGRDTDMPLAWSRDSGTLLVSANYGSGLPPHLELFTVATGQRRKLIDGLGSHDGALSADGKHLALVTYGSPARLHVVSTQTGADLFTEDLGAETRLAGPAAFTPDSKSIALLSPAGLHYVAVTGPGTASAAFPAPRGQLVAWHGNDPVLTVYRPDYALVRLRPDGSTDVLMRTTSGSLIIPRDVAEQATFGGPALEPGFEPATWLAVPAAAYAVLVSLFILLGITTYRRSRRPRRPVAADRVAAQR